MKAGKKRNTGRKIICAIVAVLAVLCIAGVVYMKVSTYGPSEAALEVMANSKESGDVSVTVTEEGYIEFMPAVGSEMGLIFYPGGLVEPEAYAPLCEEIAKEGYFVVIAPMTLNLAILSPNEADGIIKKYSSIKTWTIAGHSLGGVMACQYAAENENISGIVLLASYPQGEVLKDMEIPVLSLYGSNDGVADIEKITGAVLSKNAQIEVIEGGIHSYFGSYGHQKGDGEAAITEEEQRAQTVSYIKDFLEQLNQ